MSWNQFTFHDAEPSAEGKINLSWTCPRCNHIQTTILSAVDLIDGSEISCSNIDICGKEESYFCLTLDFEYGSYKGLSDKPLAVVAPTT